MRSFLLILALAAPLPALAQPSPGAQTISVSAETGFIVNVQVNGHPLRLRVDPALGLMLNPEVAERIGLRRSMIRPQVRVGPVRLDGSSKVARLKIGDWQKRRRFYWFPRRIVEGADGTISMADLPHEVVTLQLSVPSQREVQYVLRVEEVSTLGLIFHHRIGERAIMTRFSPLLRTSQASAAAAALLAQTHGGTWDGEPTEEPVMFGIARPVRPMRFAAPVSLNGFATERLHVRTADFRGREVLPPESEQDANEIVVTATTGRSRAEYRLTFGQDRLSACSSISYNRRVKQLTLSCRAAA